MHIIARPKLHQFAQQYPDAKTWIENWWIIVDRRRWESLHDVRRDFARVDQVGQCLVFDARGNNYRLIVRVKYADEYQRGTLFIRDFLTHADYDEDRWKKDCAPQG